MAEAQVPLATVLAVRDHPNADRLEIVEVLGWQVVVSKGSMEVGQQVIFIAPGLLVPDEWARKWGILRDNPDGTVTDYRTKGRIKAVKLRGEPSLGIAVVIGDDEINAMAALGVSVRDSDASVAEAFGITRYEPPARMFNPNNRGSFVSYEHPLFGRYTDIKNLRHNPNVFLATDYVVATEKIHGTNSRVGLINGEWMAGSRRMQRLHPSQVLSLPHCETFWQKIKRHVRDFFTPSDVGHITTEILSKTNPGSETYWYPLTLPEVRSLLESLSKDHKQVILYGEIFGPGIQKGFDYGVPVGELGYRAFDLVVDGKFVSYTTLNALCRCYGVQTAPEVYSGYFVPEVLEELTKGTSLVGGTHIREGVVVRPFQGEETDARLGRKILKLVSTEYLTRNVEDEHEAA